MVEIVEYAVAFAVSSALAASGVVLLQNYNPLVSEIALRSDFSQIANAAEISLVSNKSRTLTADLDQVSLSCQGNLLSFSTGTTTYSSALNGSCWFSYAHLAGWHKLTFVPDNGFLSVRIDP